MQAIDDEGPPIPRKLHFIWIQGEAHLKENHPVYFANVERARKLLGPGWEVHLWDERAIEVLVAERGPALLERFHSVEHLAMKADIGRVVILKKEGGIYLDTDFIVTHSLEPLCRLANEPYIALRRVRLGSFIHSLLNGSLSPKPESLQNYILMSPPDHRVWEILLNHIENFRKKGRFEHRALYYTRYTCLNALGRAVEQYLSGPGRPTPILYITQLTEYYGTHVGKGAWAGNLTTHGSFRHEIAESLNWICAVSIALNTLLILLVILLAYLLHS